MLVDALFNVTLVGAEWVLYLLIALSVASVAIIFERTVVFVINRRSDRSMPTKLRASLQRGDLDQVQALLRASRSFDGRICEAGVRAARLGVGAVEEELAGARNTEKARMEKNLGFLATVGSNAPFIGLFGTVLGIIKAFHDLSLGSKEGAAAVMAGISEALVATALGLMVAIPAVVAYNLFKRKAQTTLQQSDTLSRILLAALKAESHEPADRPQHDAPPVAQRQDADASLSLAVEQNA